MDLLDKKIYKLYRNMITRCYNPKHNSYKNYGEKGVVVCDRWKNNFKNFKEDIKFIEGWDEEKFLNGELQLDKDGKQKDFKNKVYSKTTCQFVSRKTNRILQPDVKEFYVVSPEGDISFHRGLKPFCKRMGLNPAHAGQMLNGDVLRKAVKGYQFFNHYPSEHEILKRRTYTAINPEGEVIDFYYYSGLLEYGISESTVRNRVSGKVPNPTKEGWTITLKHDGYKLQ